MTSNNDTFVQKLNKKIKMEENRLYEELKAACDYNYIDKCIVDAMYKKRHYIPLCVYNYNSHIDYDKLFKQPYADNKTSLFEILQNKYSNDYKIKFKHYYIYFSLYLIKKIDKSCILL